MFKHGDKVKVNFSNWLSNCNEIEFDGDCQYFFGDVEYEYSLHEDDQDLIEYLFENTIFTIDMVEKKKNRFNDKFKIMITLKELENFDLDYIFNELDLIGV